MFDLVGDIHGHADELEALLLKLGYSNKNGTYTHPERKVLFVGDYIDRGPKIRETLQIVRSMVESDNAIALMGNHEYNALCYHFKDEEDRPLREHSVKNKHQHQETINQFQNKQNEFEEYLNWFKTLPLFYETEKFRTVHACWDDDNINYLRKVTKDGRLTDELIYESTKRESELFSVVEETLKGKEMELPNGLTFLDKDGHERSEFRIRWWEDPKNSNYKNISVLEIESLPDDPIDPSNLPSNYYKENEKFVFFGHYWLEDEPFLYKNNVCCLDYSVANDGKLVPYRLDDETELSEGKMDWV